MPPGHERNVVFTYRYLRAAMIAMLLMLVFAVGYQVVMETAGTCWLGSISAYYYTPARTVFVGALCALGVCLVAYKGHSPAEDVLLNFSGFMAFVVAMVPTVPDSLCGANAYSQSLPEIGQAVRNNIWSLIVVTVVAAVVAAVVRRRTEEGRARPKPSRLTVLVTVACGLVLLVELVLFLVLRDRFIAVSHFTAAVTMVLGVVAVMVFSALRTEQRHEPTPGPVPLTQNPRAYKGIYLTIALILLITIVGAVLLAWLTSFDHLILWVELLVIALFCVYWGVQTRELWDIKETSVAAPAAEGREVESVSA